MEVVVQWKPSWMRSNHNTVSSVDASCNVLQLEPKSEINKVMGGNHTYMYRLYMCEKNPLIYYIYYIYILYIYYILYILYIYYIYILYIYYIYYILYIYIFSILKIRKIGFPEFPTDLRSVAVLPCLAEGLMRLELLQKGPVVRRPKLSPETPKACRHVLSQRSQGILRNGHPPGSWEIPWNLWIWNGQIRKDLWKWENPLFFGISNNFMGFHGIQWDMFCDHIGIIIRITRGYAEIQPLSRI